MAARSMMLLSLVMATAALAVGCGGGDDDASGSPNTSAVPTPSKAEYIKQASAACKRERADMASEITAYLRAQRGKGETRAELYSGLAQFVVLPTIEAEMFRMRELGVPPEEEPSIDAMLGAQETAINRVATSNNITSIAAIRRRFRQADRQYELFGLLACAAGPKRES